MGLAVGAELVSGVDEIDGLEVGLALLGWREACSSPCGCAMTPIHSLLPFMTHRCPFMTHR